MANSVPDRGGPQRSVVNLRRNGVKVGYDHVNGDGDSITCDNCGANATHWYSNDFHAICETCARQKYDENDIYYSGGVN